MKRRRKRRRSPNRGGLWRTCYRTAGPVERKRGLEKFCNGEGNILARTYAVLRANEDAVLFAAFGIARCARIAILPVVVLRGGVERRTMRLAMPMTAAAFGDSILRVRGVRMRVVPAAPQQPVSDESRRRQQRDKVLKHEMHRPNNVNPSRSVGLPASRVNCALRPHTWTWTTLRSPSPLFIAMRGWNGRPSRHRRPKQHDRTATSAARCLLSTRPRELTRAELPTVP